MGYDAYQRTIKEYLVPKLPTTNDEMKVLNLFVLFNEIIFFKSNFNKKISIHIK